jgi:hypothetical protein
MIFNANKFGNGGRQGSESGSVSPQRRTPNSGRDKPNKSPKTRNQDGMSILSHNSSGKFSRLNGLGGGGQANESVRGEPLEVMSCPSHDGLPLDHYSLNIREFLCKQCIREIEGSQREIDLAPMPVDEAFKIMEARVQMQKLVQIDEKIRGMLENVRKRKEFSIKEKEESLKQVGKMFDVIYRRLEERKNTLY